MSNSRPDDMTRMSKIPQFRLPSNFVDQTQPDGMPYPQLPTQIAKNATSQQSAKECYVLSLLDYFAISLSKE